MDWLSRMNKAIDYIEENLAGDIDYTQAAGIACCSLYHFQRLFSFIADIPLSDYIRRRRLTLAAFDLQNSGDKVIDVALKYGYDSPTSFTRAFLNLHGVTPSLARDPGVPLKAFPRITFQISIKGDTEMNYKIEEKPTFSVFGMEEIFTTKNGENLKAIPAFWLRAMRSGMLERLYNASGVSWSASSTGIKPVNAVMCYRETGENTFPYMIFALVSPRGLPDGYTAIEVPAATWAVFQSVEHTEDKTAEVCQDLWKRIYTEWFPTASYEQVPGAQFEMYGVSKKGLDYVEIWIPVKKTKN